MDNKLKDMMILCAETTTSMKGATIANAIIASKQGVARLNKGEKAELSAIKKSIELSKLESPAPLTQIFGEEAAKGIAVLDPKTLEPYTDIQKSLTGYKADVVIEMNSTKKRYFTSIKSANCAAPAILNHTPRCASIFQPNGTLHHLLPDLDKCFHEYIDKRYKQDSFNQDISLSQLDSFASTRGVWSELLSHFLFDGTGKGFSEARCNAMMIYNINSGDIQFHRYDTNAEKQAYAHSLLDNCIVSLRNKGMPARPNSTRGEKYQEKYTLLKELCLPWCYIETAADGTLIPKGSLHVRCSFN